MEKKSLGIAALLQIFFGIFGAGRFYLKHNLKGIIHLAITVIAIISLIISKTGDLYTITYGINNGSGGVGSSFTTMTFSNLFGLQVFATFSLIVNFFWCLCSGIGIVLFETLPIKNFKSFTILPIIILCVGVLGGTLYFNYSDMIDNGKAVEFSLNTYNFEIEETSDFSSITFNIIPNVEIKCIELELNLYNYSSDLITSYCIIGENMICDEVYSYKFEMDSNVILSLKNYTYSVDGTIVRHYYAEKIEKT